jgi:hypothetical protein
VDFRNVVRVDVNETPAPNYVVASKTQLLVQMPIGLETKRVESISVLSDNFTSTESSKLTFELGLNPKSVSGLQRMVQIFVLYLLRTPGSDVWKPGTGGGLQSKLGSVFAKDQTSGLTAEFSLAVNRVRSQIISMQTGNVRLTPDERLASATVLSAVYSRAQTALLARVELIAQSGRRAAVGLEL